MNTRNLSIAVVALVVGCVCTILALAQAGRTQLNRAYLASPLDANNQAITNLPAPASADQATRKSYVDTAVAGATETAGKGLVKSGSTFHFAQSGNYTVGTIPFAATTSTVGFNSLFTWDDANMTLGIGFGPVIKLDGNTGNSRITGTLVLTDSGFPTADASSLLDLRSTTHGLLAPRMTTTQRNAISSPATGLLIVNTTTSSLDLYNGSTWASLVAGSAGTVTSVGLSVPSWLTVAGSPITTSGTLAVTAASGQTANRVLATPDGSTGAVGLRQLVPHDIAAGPEGFFLVVSNGAPEWTTNFSDATFTNVTVLQTINATTIKVQGKNVPALHINATNTAPDVNIQDSATVTWVHTGGSNWTANAAGGGGVSGTAGFVNDSFGFIQANQTNIDAGTAGTNAFVIIGGSGSSITNFMLLTNAYAKAQLKTPHGAALATDNRFTVFLLPGVYDFGTNALTLSSQFIDIVGISENTGTLTQPFYTSSPTYQYGDTVIKGTSAVINGAMTDVVIANLCLVSSGVTFSPSSTAPSTRMRNVLIVRTGFAYNSAMANINYQGEYRNVRCFNIYAFGGGSAVTQTGIFYDCFVGTYAWGGDGGTDNATHYNCVSLGVSYGTFFGGLAYNCIELGGDGFGRSGFSGKAFNCVNRGGGAGFGNLGTMSGYLENCFDEGAYAATVTGTIRNSTLGGREYAQTGSETVLIKKGGTLKVNTTTTGNVGGGEDNLITFSVPASTLAVNGDYLEFDCFGTFAANANTKRLKVYFGATAIFDSTALVFNGVDWKAHGKIIRVGATTQKTTTQFTISGTLLGAVTTATTTSTTAAETLSGAITFKCTGEDSGGTPVNDSVVQHGEVIRWYPTN